MASVVTVINAVRAARCGKILARMTDGICISLRRVTGQQTDMWLNSSGLAESF